MDKATPPLTGIRVLELGELIAGPFVGTLLGEFGAEVIKIERPGQGDVLRQFGPIVNGKSLYWLVNSRNKKSMVLDLRVPEGRSVFGDLIDKSDVLIVSLRPGTLEGWGFDETTLRTRYPRLVIVYASAFGRQGPYQARGGYDPIAQGFSGLSYVTGAADGPPMRAGGAIPVCDFMTGLMGAFGAVLALFDRDARKSREGQSIDVALYDMAFRMLGPLLSLYDVTGKVWQRDGNHSLGGAPTGHFETADGSWVCISVQNDEQFVRCAGLVGRLEWLEDARFKSLKLRTQNRDAIEEVVADWIKSRPRHSVLKAFQEAGLGAGPINSVADMAEDQHLSERGSVWVEDPALGRFRVPAVFPFLSRTPGHVNSHAPTTGMNTDEVLTKVLGYSSGKLRALQDRNVIPARLEGEP
jgi:formyl-CoA transferase